MHNLEQNQDESDEPFGSIEFYLSTLYVGLGCFLIGFFKMTATGNSGLNEPLLWVGGLIFTIAEIYFLVLLYRVWRFIIEESQACGLVTAIETPAKAIGFLFIPFYNMYWVFQAFGKLPRDLNALANAKGNAGMVPESLGITAAFFSVLGLIPGVGYFTMIVRSSIVQPMLIKKSVDLCKGIKGQEKAFSWR